MKFVPVSLDVIEHPFDDLGINSDASTLINGDTAYEELNEKLDDVKLGIYDALKAYDDVVTITDKTSVVGNSDSFPLTSTIGNLAAIICIR